MVFAWLILYCSVALLVLARYPVARAIDVSPARAMFSVIIWLTLLFVSLISLRDANILFVVLSSIGVALGSVYLLSRSREGRRLAQSSAPREYTLILVSIFWLSHYARSPYLTHFMIVICITTWFIYVYDRYIRWDAAKKKIAMRVEYTNLIDHVVLFGYRDLTIIIIKALHAAHIPYVIIESNHQKAIKAKLNGYAVVESTQGTAKEFLTYSAMSRAKCLIMFEPSGEIAEQLIFGGKKLNPSLFILATAVDEPSSKRLAALGADIVLQQDFELALSVIKHIAIVHKIKREHVNLLLQKLRFIQGAAG